MLVLSRNVNESIVIADSLIEVRIVRVRGDRVWLGVSAPKDIPIRRTELEKKEDVDRGGK